MVRNGLPDFLLIPWLWPYQGSFSKLVRSQLAASFGFACLAIHRQICPLMLAQGILRTRNVPNTVLVLRRSPPFLPLFLDHACESENAPQ